jgi:RHH-type proline utilization regulon transcriptional repressor/proline dehydrogenase/delta 1-pyrroline-5-carboxylate dehydrogenase
VLYSGPVVEARRLRNELAARDGALVPLILSDVRDFPLYRLTVERVITVNTTAAGGNATLIMLDA